MVPVATGRGSFLGVANALVYAGVNTFDVASMSLGGYFNHAEFNAVYVLLNRATQFARANGVPTRDDFAALVTSATS